jgi:hypothetical protein
MSTMDRALNRSSGRRETDLRSWGSSGKSGFEERNDQ